jgi:hypothetical protein
MGTGSDLRRNPWSGVGLEQPSFPLATLALFTLSRGVGEGLGES